MARPSRATEPADPGRAASRVPDFFIVGQPKSGTTALYEILRRHPQVYMPALKEPVFLASDVAAGLRWPTVRARPRTLEEYLALFAPAKPDQRAGEASSLYLWSHYAAANIARLQPGARIVAILREPASFLRSLHLQMLQDHSETESDLRKALALEDDRRQGKRVPRSCPRPPALFYSEYVRYVDQLRRYGALFSPEQVLVLIYDDFRADNEGTARAVLRFLDVDDTLPIDVTEANPTVRLRSKQLDEVVQGVSTGRGPVVRAVKKPLKTLSSRRLRHGALRLARRRILYAQPRAPEEEVMIELRRGFREEVVALGEYLDRDLVSLWGYDSVTSG
jgi:Sulfotransferase family